MENEVVKNLRYDELEKKFEQTKNKIRARKMNIIWNNVIKNPFV